METTIDQADLVTVNLKYGSSAKPLKSLAFAQLSAKALFLSKTPQRIDAIGKTIAALIGVRKVSIELIEGGLAYLQEIGKVKQKNGQWILSNDARGEIGKSIAAANDHVATILKKHFPTSLDRKVLRKWFVEALAQLFGHFGDEWVSELSRGGSGGGRLLRGRTLDELLLPTIRQFHLESSQEALVEGVVRFLSSEDNSDQQYLMLISQAMFSARLVAADVGVDPITLQELKESKFLLDTNVIFAIVLEGGRLATAIQSLEEALKAINAKLVYLHTTKQEYERALGTRKEQVLQLVEIYPDEVLRDLDDDILVTARGRACNSRADYERFFASIAAIPKSLPGGYEIRLEDDAQIEAVREAAEKDNGLKRRIQEFSVKYRPKWRGLKKELAQNHDSTLFHVTRFIRQENGKCWIMSLDRSLQRCGLEEVGPHGVPELISVSALIEMLAVNNAGPDLDATQFAPLLSRMIMNECMPPPDTYISQDLVVLHKINEKAAELPPEEIRKLAMEVMRARCEGRGPDDTRLALTINRMYQDSVKHVTEELESARKRATHAEKAVEQELAKRQARERQLVASKAEGIRGKALRKLVGLIVLWVLIAGVATWTALKLYHSFFAGEEPKEIVDYILGVASFILPLWWQVPKTVAKYKQECAESVAMASRALDN